MFAVRVSGRVGAPEVGNGAPSNVAPLEVTQWEVTSVRRRLFSAAAFHVSFGAGMGNEPGGLIGALFDEVHRASSSLSAWGVAWARVLPTVLVVPAFGLGVLPVSLRVIIAFALALAIAPAVQVPLLAGEGSWLHLIVRELLSGLPVAVAASVSLWAAVVAGGVGDVAAGTARLARPSPLGRDAPPLSMLLGLAASIAFLNGGGATRVAARLVVAKVSGPPLGRAVTDLATGIGMGASIGGPLLVVALVMDLATAIVTRESAFLRASVMAPLRSLIVLVAAAVLLDRMAEAAVVLGNEL